MDHLTNDNLERLIQEIYSSLETNNFKTLGRPENPLYDSPLIGVAAGEDPYFEFLKEHIGPFHWDPVEVFQLNYPEPILAENLRVVSFVFPQTAMSKQTQAEEKLRPSREWIVSRGEWEPMMQEFSGKLVQSLEEQGIRSVSIDLQPEYQTETSDNLGIASRWSHRHAAFIAGLGTFGLSEGLITERGKAVRLTSLVIEAPLTITPRPYQSHVEWCLFYRDGSCMACVKRCPTGAITEKGHDKDACDAYEYYFAEHYWPEDIERGDYIIGCGLCQAAVPCQNKRP